MEKLDFYTNWFLHQDKFCIKYTNAKKRKNKHTTERYVNFYNLSITESFSKHENSETIKMKICIFGCKKYTIFERKKHYKQTQIVTDGENIHQLYVAWAHLGKIKYIYLCCIPGEISWKKLLWNIYVSCLRGFIIKNTNLYCKCRLLFKNYYKVSLIYQISREKMDHLISRIGQMANHLEKIKLYPNFTSSCNPYR